LLPPDDFVAGPNDSPDLPMGEGDYVCLTGILVKRRHPALLQMNL
jgi:hypothetical protein